VTEQVRYVVDSFSITWERLSTCATLDQAQAALTSWREETRKPLRIVREVRRIVYADPLPEASHA